MVFRGEWSDAEFVSNNFRLAALLLDAEETRRVSKSEEVTAALLLEKLRKAADAVLEAQHRLDALHDLAIELNADLRPLEQRTSALAIAPRQDWKVGLSDVAFVSNNIELAALLLDIEETRREHDQALAIKNIRRDIAAILVKQPSLEADLSEAAAAARRFLHPVSAAADALQREYLRGYNDGLSKFATVG
jgi:hypothetical protein